jgi:hypothetical protein
MIDRACHKRFPVFSCVFYLGHFFTLAKIHLIHRLALQDVTEPTRAHELDIHFRHPIVGDGIKYKDPKKKTLGYKVLNGSKTTQIRVEKRDGRGK